MKEQIQEVIDDILLDSLDVKSEYLILTAPAQEKNRDKGRARIVNNFTDKVNYYLIFPEDEKIVPFYVFKDDYADRVLDILGFTESEINFKILT